MIFGSNSDLVYLDKNKTTNTLTSFMNKNNYVKDFAFGSYNLNEVLNYFVSQANATSILSFDFQLMNNYRSLRFRISLAERNHFDVINTDLL